MCNYGAMRMGFCISALRTFYWMRVSFVDRLYL